MTPIRDKILISLILDANSNVITMTQHEKTISDTYVTFATTFEYDNLDRVIQTISPIGVIRGCSYDSRNNVTYTVDGEGNTSSSTYDGINRLLEVSRDIRDNGKGSGSITDTVTTQYIWDDNSRLVVMIDDNGRPVTYTYDALNRTKKQIYADEKFKEFTYDDADNITYYTDPNGSDITQTFDDINRLTGRTINPGTGVTGVTSESYTYDGISRMLTAYNSYSTVTFGYDTMSRLLTEQQQLSGFNARTATSAYNNVGFRTQLTYPSNKVINFVPDAVNRITNVQDASYNNIAQYQYVGYRVEERSYLNDTKLTVNYDDNARVITYSHGASIAGFAYGYDKEDNKLFEKRTHGTKGDAYVYDSIYRATGVKYGVPNTELSASTAYADYNNYDSIEQFNLDGVGNRLNVYNGVTTTYTTNNLNEYTNISGTDLTYDDNGNLTGDGTYTYSYDYANRLIEVKQGETSIALFKYDALGRRIEKVSANGTVHYYYDGARVIEECDGSDSDSLQKSYTHGNRIDELLTMETITGTYYYHENTLGSIYAVTDEDGNVVERYEYSIYGIPIFFDATGTEISGTAISNNYLYTGREYDVETGLYNYRARYYSPDLGRFLGRDPKGYIDGVNLYEYVGSNPMNWVDPFGTDKGKGQNNAGNPPSNQSTPADIITDASPEDIPLAYQMLSLAWTHVEAFNFWNGVDAGVKQFEKEKQKFAQKYTNTNPEGGFTDADEKKMQSDALKSGKKIGRDMLWGAFKFKEYQKEVDKLKPMDTSKWSLLDWALSPFAATGYVWNYGRRPQTVLKMRIPGLAKLEVELNPREFMELMERMHEKEMEKIKELMGMTIKSKLSEKDRLNFELSIKLNEMIMNQRKIEDLQYDLRFGFIMKF